MWLRLLFNSVRFWRRCAFYLFNLTFVLWQISPSSLSSECWCVGSVPCSRPPPVHWISFKAHQEPSSPASPSTRNTSGHGDESPTPQRKQKRGAAQSPGRHQPAHLEHTSAIIGMAQGRGKSGPPTPALPPHRGQGVYPPAPKDTKEKWFSKFMGKGQEPDRLSSSRGQHISWGSSWKIAWWARCLCTSAKLKEGSF